MLSRNEIYGLIFLTQAAIFVAPHINALIAAIYGLFTVVIGLLILFKSEK